MSARHVRIAGGAVDGGWVGGKAGSMYSDLRACTTPRVKGVFCAVCAAADAIPLAGDAGVTDTAAKVRGIGLEEKALAGVGAGLPLALNLLRIATAGEQLLAGGEAGPAIARRTAEGVLARRSRVMGQVIWELTRMAIGTGHRQGSSKR